MGCNDTLNLINGGTNEKPLPIDRNAEGMRYLDLIDGVILDGSPILYYGRNMTQNFEFRGYFCGPDGRRRPKQMVSDVCDVKNYVENELKRAFIVAPDGTRSNAKSTSPGKEASEEEEGVYTTLSGHGVRVDKRLHNQADFNMVSLLANADLLSEMGLPPNARLAIWSRDSDLVTIGKYDPGRIIIKSIDAANNAVLAYTQGQVLERYCSKFSVPETLERVVAFLLMIIALAAGTTEYLEQTSVSGFSRERLAKALLAALPPDHSDLAAVEKILLEAAGDFLVAEYKKVEEKVNNQDPLLRDWQKLVHGGEDAVRAGFLARYYVSNFSFVDDGKGNQKPGNDADPKFWQELPWYILEAMRAPYISNGTIPRPFATVTEHLTVHVPKTIEEVALLILRECVDENDYPSVLEGLKNAMKVISKYFLAHKPLKKIQPYAVLAVVLASGSTDSLELACEAVSANQASLKKLIIQVVDMYTTLCSKLDLTPENAIPIGAFVSTSRSSPFQTDDDIEYVDEPDPEYDEEFEPAAGYSFIGKIDQLYIPQAVVATMDIIDGKVKVVRSPTESYFLDAKEHRTNTGYLSYYLSCCRPMLRAAGVEECSGWQYKFTRAGVDHLDETGERHILTLNLELLKPEGHEMTVENDTECRCFVTTLSSLYFRSTTSEIVKNHLTASSNGVLKVIPIAGQPPLEWTCAGDGKRRASGVTKALQSIGANVGDTIALSIKTDEGETLPLGTAMLKLVERGKYSCSFTRRLHGWTEVHGGFNFNMSGHNALAMYRHLEGKADAMEPTLGTFPFEVYAVSEHGKLVHANAELVFDSNPKNFMLHTNQLGEIARLAGVKTNCGYTIKLEPRKETASAFNLLWEPHPSQAQDSASAEVPIRAHYYNYKKHLNFSLDPRLESLSQGEAVICLNGSPKWTWKFVPNSFKLRVVAASSNKRAVSEAIKAACKVAGIDQKLNSPWIILVPIEGSPNHFNIIASLTEDGKDEVEDTPDLGGPSKRARVSRTL